MHELFSFNYMHFNCPIAYQKDFLTEYELFSANNMLLFGLVHS